MAEQSKGAVAGCSLWTLPSALSPQPLGCLAHWWSCSTGWTRLLMFWQLFQCSSVSFSRRNFPRFALPNKTRKQLQLWPNKYKSSDPILVFIGLLSRLKQSQKGILVEETWSHRADIQRLLAGPFQKVDSDGSTTYYMLGNICLFNVWERFQAHVGRWCAQFTIRITKTTSRVPFHWTARKWNNV